MAGKTLKTNGLRCATTSASKAGRSRPNMSMTKQAAHRSVRISSRCSVTPGPQVRLGAVLEPGPVQPGGRGGSTLNHLERLTNYGVSWRSHTEQYLDSCRIFRDAVLAILAVIAKQERIRRSARASATISRLRRQGRTDHLGLNLE